MGKGLVDEGILARSAHYGRAKTSALLVGPPFGYAAPCAGLSHTLPAD